MSDTLTTRMRINRVEHWRPEYADGGPILTQIELRDAHDDDQPRLVFEHQADGQYVPTRLVLNVIGKVTDLEPGDYLAVTLVKLPPVPQSARREHEIPF